MWLPPRGARRLATATALTGALVLATSCGNTDLHSLAAQYTAIAVAGNRNLDADFDALSGRDHADLAAARRDLHDVASTERRFDRQLLALDLPAAIAATAHALVAANEVRASLTARAAASPSLAELQGWMDRLHAAEGPVEQQVRRIRAQLGLPPPDTT
jgi:hypothetical protein